MFNEREQAITRSHAIVFPHDRFDGLGGLFGVIPRDRRKMVMEHMGMSYVVKEMGTDKANFMVDCSVSTPYVRPMRVLVMWDGGISMVEIRDGNSMPVSEDR